jgi:hypothetical protein
MKKYIIFYIVSLFTIGGFVAQGPPPPPGGPSCWPPSANCDPVTPVPLNDGIWLLFLFGGGYVLYKNRKELSKNET